MENEIIIENKKEVKNNIRRIKEIINTGVKIMK